MNKVFITNMNNLDQKINEAAKILIDNGWSYLDCIKVLKSTTPEYSIRATETGRSPSTVPTWGTPDTGVPYTITPGSICKAPSDEAFPASIKGYS